MKAITLHQPWATLIALGIKRHETRTWKPSLQVGELLAIHAGMQTNALAMRDFDLDLKGLVITNGAVLAVTRFMGVRSTNDGADGVSLNDYCAGDWSPGRYAWRLELLCVFDKPVPARGMQGLWNWEPPAPIAGKLRETE